MRWGGGLGTGMMVWRICRESVLGLIFDGELGRGNMGCMIGV